MSIRQQILDWSSGCIGSPSLSWKRALIDCRVCDLTNERVYLWIKEKKIAVVKICFLVFFVSFVVVAVILLGVRLHHTTDNCMLFHLQKLTTKNHQRLKHLSDVFLASDA